MTPPCGRKSHKSSTLLHWCQLDDSAEESWCAVYREHCTTGQVTQVTSWPAHHQCVSRQQHTVEWAGNIDQCDVNIYMNSEMGGWKIDIHTETPHEKNMKQITNISDKGGNFVIWLESWSLSDKHVDWGFWSSLPIQYTVCGGATRIPVQMPTMRVVAGDVLPGILVLCVTWG